MENPIYQALLRRRSVRKYKDIPVEREALTQLVMAAAAAPSASNRQPWEFVVVSGAQAMEKLRGVHKYSNYNAPAAIVVCFDKNKGYEGDLAAFSVQDCSAAAQNIMLAALDYGLGTCWIGIHPVADRQEYIDRVIALPDHVTTMGVIYVGYPAAEPQPRTQFTPEILHWEKY